MKKRTTVRVLTFLSAAVIVMGILAWNGMRKAKVLELYARASNQRAFDELVTNVTELSNALEKSIYVTDPALESALCTQVFGRAMMAQMSMGELPYSSQNLEQTASFVSKVGDYASVLARTVGTNGGYSQEELENLKALSETASIMALNLQDMQARLTAGELSMDEVYKTMQDTGLEREEAPLAGTVFETIEAEFPELPSLIYDGPFSEALTGREPIYLSGMKQSDEESAKKAAAQFLNINAASLVYQGETGGKIPCYCFASYLNGGEYIIYVTKQGAIVSGVLCSRAVKEENYSVDTGLSLADAIVDELDMGDMEQSYHMVSDGVLLVNYEHVEDDVMCYPDLIKIGIALDNGLLVSYDAQGFISSHHDREMPEAEISRTEAQESIPESLTVQSYQMALIPSAGGEERLCHEFVCRSEEGQRYIIYVNAITGSEEKILILLEDEQGALTI